MSYKIPNDIERKLKIYTERYEYFKSYKALAEELLINIPKKLIPKLTEYIINYLNIVNIHIVWFIKCAYLKYNLDNHFIVLLTSYHLINNAEYSQIIHNSQDCYLNINFIINMDFEIYFNTLSIKDLSDPLNIRDRVYDYLINMRNDSIKDLKIRIKEQLTIYSNNEINRCKHQHNLNVKNVCIEILYKPPVGHFKGGVNYILAGNDFESMLTCQQNT